MTVSRGFFSANECHGISVSR